MGESSEGAGRAAEPGGCKQHLGPPKSCTIIPAHGQGRSPVKAHVATEKAFLPPEKQLAPWLWPQTCKKRLAFGVKRENRRSRRPPPCVRGTHPASLPTVSHPGSAAQPRPRDFQRW